MSTQQDGIPSSYPLEHDTIINSNYRSPADLESQVSKENIITINRLPTLYEVLNRKTRPPVDIWSFYCYMRDNQRAIDYLDFWIDCATHLSLCKCYVNGLKKKLEAENFMKNQRESKGIQKQEIHDFKDVDDDDEEEDEKILKNTNNRGKSMTSSMLLDLIMEDNFLDDEDNHRMSAFLRGERGLITDNAEVQEYIENLNRQSVTSGPLLDLLNDPEEKLRDDSHSEEILSNIYNSEHIQRQKLLTSDSGTDDDDEDNKSINHHNTKRISTIRPEMIEKFIEQERKSDNRKSGGTLRQQSPDFITREKLRESSKRIILTYFTDSSSKRLIIPEHITRKIQRALEVEGRDDPEVFEEAREYVFRAMENEAFPNFLASVAISNITDISFVFRLALGLFILFVGFWVGYTLIFLNYKRSTRAVVILPFFIGSYLTITAWYYLDPILCFLGYSESHTSLYGIVKLQEPFVKKILLKRSIWTFLCICLSAAALSCVFALVPSTRL
ncbi:hypothetical protein PACTADRAFT_45361 [Pachysolen tannophilus NRRL Y-2460]|uniref:RGS domain-containing protein n=1 Tax=Pachysolen tannophilus NRRL Y-2460 TaxID=669874 RepID=A0A1E4TQ20_PACTA|nr:hypothetical protein PACTADRAFT_45361 [Pachysolen tannophilus NRRL Y-2460]